MIDFEGAVKALYPGYTLKVEHVSSALDRFRVVYRGIECSDSGVRELAFKYALQELEAMEVVSCKDPVAVQLSLGIN